MIPVILIDTGVSRLWVIPGYYPDVLPYLQQLPLQFEPPVARGLQS
jgi:hypothetical protein